MRALLAVLTVPLVAFAAAEKSQIFLPGTQPEEGGIEFAKAQQCRMCHADTKNGDADPFFSWQGGMMSQAARDPVFRASVAIANQDIEGVGEFCFRCHTPRGWLEGRSMPPDGSTLNGEDMQGVVCDVCHSLVDIHSEEAKEFAEHVPPGYGNAMMVADPNNVVRGPYGEGNGAMPHGVLKSDFHASSELCAVCHNVSNPVYAEDVKTQPPYAYGHLERTYSEWKLSDFATRGAEGTCQSCHYPKVEGGGQASRFGSPQRDHFVMHGPVGSSTWVQLATAKLWPTSAVDTRAMRQGIKRTRALLKTAASLELSFPESGQGSLRVTNLTGHKLPTGYIEGRRMWVNLRFLDADGTLVGEVGRFGEAKDTLAGEAVTAPTLLDPDGTRIYECLPGMSEAQAKKHSKKPGKSFHFVLNDVIVKDNRIPPQGFKNEAFAEHLAAPVAATYADGQHWDDFAFPVPEGAARVEARLMHQSVTWEYIKFLAEENRTDDWGRKLYGAWRETGMCPPEVVAETAAKVAR